MLHKWVTTPENSHYSQILFRNYDILEIMTVCLPDALWVLFLEDAGSKYWLINNPSCSSAKSVLTLRDKEPGLISGRLTSPDSSKLRATSAKHVSYNRENVTNTHSSTIFYICENTTTYHLATF